MNSRRCQAYHVSVSLNRSARAIWDLCDGQRTILEISQKLEKTFNRGERSLVSEVVEAILRFCELELLAL